MLSIRPSYTTPLFRHSRRRATPGAGETVPTIAPFAEITTTASPWTAISTALPTATDATSASARTTNISRGQRSSRLPPPPPPPEPPIDTTFSLRDAAVAASAQPDSMATVASVQRRIPHLGPDYGIQDRGAHVQRIGESEEPAFQFRIVAGQDDAGRENSHGATRP